jgi:hypothetical protein
MDRSASPNEQPTTRGAARKRKRRRTRAVVFVAVAVAAFGAAAAFAAWQVGGGGSGTTTAVSAQNLTTSAATTTAALYPGITGANLYLTVNNTNPFPVTITSVNTNGAAVPDAAHASGCVTTGVSYATTATTKTVPANGSLSFTVPSVSMSNASDTGCQGATFTIPVSFTATS